MKLFNAVRAAAGAERRGGEGGEGERDGGKKGTRGKGEGDEQEGVSGIDWGKEGEKDGDSRGLRKMESGSKRWRALKHRNGC